jgi:hypothetical protein
MKRTLLLIGLLSGPALANQCQITSPLPVPVLLTGCTYSGALPSNSTDYIQQTLSPSTTSQMFSVQTSSVSGGEYLSYITGTQCLEEVNGETVGTGAACGAGGGGTWGSITGTLSNQTDLQTIINNIGSSTATLEVQIVNIGASTASLQVQLTNVGISTTAIASSTSSIQVQINGLETSTTTLQTELNAVGVSTTNIAASTASLQSQVSLATTYSSFTAVQPILYNGSGQFSATLISLSTGVTSSLPAASIAAGALGSGVIASSLAVTGAGAGSCTNCNVSFNAEGQETTYANGSGGSTNPGAPVNSVQVNIGSAFAGNANFTDYPSTGEVYNTYGITMGSATVNNLTASQFVVTDGSKNLASSLNGSTLTNLTAANISAGSLGSGVIASSIAVGAITNPNLVSGSFTNITGVGTLSAGTWSATRLLSSEIPTDVAYLDVNQLWTSPQTYSSSETVTASGGLGVTYNVNIGSITGAGLTSCSGASSAVTWNSSTNQFGCNTISGSGSPGGSPNNAQYDLAGAFAGDPYLNLWTSSATYTEPVIIGSSMAANALSVSSATTSINPFLSVSSTPAQSPTDYVLNVSSANGLVLLGVQNNGNITISDLANNFSNFPSTGFFLSASSTTSNTSLATFANFQFQIGPSEVWSFTCNIGVTGATGGAKYGINGPAGATVQARVFGPLATASAFTSASITALNTASIAFHTAAAATFVEITGTMINSTTGGQWVLQREEGTSGDTSTALTGSYCQAWRIQ